ncbi:hypothetical protein Aperf_G00000063359 [Anoplocephala perfoliata]
MRLLICYLLVCDDYLAIHCRRCPPPSAEESHPRFRSHLAATLHLFLIGLVFLTLAAILIAFELASSTPYRIGYWTGALGCLSAIAVCCVAAKTNHLTLIFLLSVNSFTILACTIVALTSMQSNDKGQVPSYWLCLGILTCSVYSAIFVMVKHGLPMGDSTIREQNANVMIPSMEQSAVREPQPPEGFMLPGEEHYLPKYESLTHPPTYFEAMRGCNSGDLADVVKANRCPD